jgi:hypothetical protein
MPYEWDFLLFIAAMSSFFIIIVNGGVVERGGECVGYVLRCRPGMYSLV